MKILFLLHSTATNGATNYAINLVNYLFKRSLTVDYISLDNQLLPNLPSKRVYFNFEKKIQYTLLNLKNFFLKRDLLTRFDVSILNLRNENYSLIYANTIANLRLAVSFKLRMPTIKVILHLHEMETIIKQNFEDISYYDGYIEKYIVVSVYTKQYLLSLGVKESKISLIDACADIPILSNSKIQVTDFFNVVMVGEAHWRKGDDLFLLLAKKTVLQNSNIHFYWIGNVEKNRKIVLQEDIKKLGLSNFVTLIDEVPNPNDYVSLMDVFVLTSREDPFPLVAIEAGMLGLPIVCFQSSTGLEEDIKRSGGLIVPYLDIDKMAESILQVKKNHQYYLDTKDQRKEYFQRFNPERICEEIYKEIKPFIK